MFDRLVVPLDGSTLSERALFYAVRLANLAQQDLLLLRVAEPSSAVKSRDLQLSPVPDSDYHYLEAIKARITDPLSEHKLLPERVQTEVVTGKPEEAITAVVASQKGNLLVMSTHGETGLSRELPGNVTLGVLRRLSQPVLLVGPACEVNHLSDFLPDTFNFGLDRAPVVVALDSAGNEEEIIETAVNFARHLETEIHLLKVARVPSPAIAGDPGAGIGLNLSDLDNEHEIPGEGTRAYLENIRGQIEAKGVPCVARVSQGEEAPVILEYIRHVRACTVEIGMNRPGRGENGQPELGGVIEKVLAWCQVPVLTVPGA